MKMPVDDGFCLLASRYVRKQLRQLGDQFDGLRRSEDIEFVHRARVASRRLRAGLRLFRDCFPPSQVKRWRKEVRRLTRSLGDARDKDVQIQFLCSILGDLKDQAPCRGVGRVLARLERRREKLQPKVLAALTRFRSSGVRREMLGLTKRMLTDLREREVKVASQPVLDRAEKQIVFCVDELLSFRQCLSDPQAHQQHHAMRIAAKRLRYTMEICEPAYGDLLGPLISAVKDLQTLLGDLHDCDVWVTDLETMLKDESRRIEDCYGHTGPLAGLRAGFEYLREERRGERVELFGRLRQLWGQLEKTEFWERLIGTVRWRASVSSASFSPELEQTIE